MKKFGFTLSELLITVGIVGVVAALTAPAVSNIMPDRNKMMFMKNYKELTTITEKLLQDPELYYTTYTLNEETGRKEADCIGLGCFGKPLKPPYNTSEYEGKNKYRQLMARFLGNEDTNYQYFSTPDNTYWDFRPDWNETNDSNKPFTYGANIRFNVLYQGTTHKTYCYYGEKNRPACTTNPKIFVLHVDTYGNVTPYKKDYLAQAYLLNPTRMNNKKWDLACAAAIAANTDTTKTPAEICAELDD